MNDHKHKLVTNDKDYYFNDHFVPWGVLFFTLIALSKANTNYISTIKAVRNLTGMSLYDAKAFCDTLRDIVGTPQKPYEIDAAARQEIVNILGPNT